MTQYYTVFEREPDTGGVITLRFTEAEIKRAAKRKIPYGQTHDTETWKQWQYEARS